MCPKVTQTLPQVFGRRVREVRQLRGLSQTDLAGRVHIDRTTLNKVERGRRSDVTLSTLFALADALEIAPVYLLMPRRFDEYVELAPGREPVTGKEARDWIRGAWPKFKTPRQMADWLLTLPQDEQLEFLIENDPEIAKTAGNPLARLLAGGEALADRVRTTTAYLESERRRRTKEGRNG